MPKHAQAKPDIARRAAKDQEKGTALDAFNLEFAKDIAPDRPILIAGATASGKSALALALADRWGGQIINADALQVYDGWRLLTARPSAADEERCPHHLYGHVPFLGDYSVGAWLRDLAPLLRTGPRPIIVGGTGLYFRALTEGLAEIPPVPKPVRIVADEQSHAALLADLEQSDPVIYAKIDRQNRARVQRAWEVWRATGKPLSQWQAETPAPLLPLDQVAAFKLMADRDWLNELEVVPDRVALEISKRTNLVLLGMGAGPYADAQYLFAEDVLGYTRGHKPRHAKTYRDFRSELDRLQEERIAAFAEFKADVDTGAYPAAEHSVTIKDDEFDAFVLGLL